MESHGKSTIQSSGYTPIIVRKPCAQTRVHSLIENRVALAVCPAAPIASLARRCDAEWAPTRTSGPGDALNEVYI